MMCERLGFGWALKKVYVVPLRFNYEVATYFLFYFILQKIRKMNWILILLNVSNLQLVENLHHFGPIYNLSKKIQSFGPKHNLPKKMIKH